MWPIMKQASVLVGYKVCLFTAVSLNQMNGRVFSFI